ncbi:MAG TPA: succinylglutamate desuccinylase/aspartoacylase family protein [Opitutaceae bacterium]|nr:succinylglutamate desuccinylase/aspartoacylase family protein [Opitutaceae bacterium]
MVQLVQPQFSRDLRTLFGPLYELAEQSTRVLGTLAGTFTEKKKRHAIPRFLFSGPEGGQDSVKIGLFAGLHGDEPAGCTALVRLLLDLANDPELATGYDLMVYPVCNPIGYLSGKRENGRGKDLNREFWRSSIQPEIKILEAELRLHQFNGIITLHADDTCDGLYGYAHGATLNEALLKPALAVSERFLPRDSRTRIDGFEANNGIICTCFDGVLAAPPEQHPAPFDIIFETPANASLDLQVEASLSALHTILAEYRGFIAQGADL